MKLLKGMTLAAALLSISTGSVFAGFTATNAGPLTTDTDVAPGAAFVGAGNGSFTYNHAGPDFIPGTIDISVDATPVNAATWGSELSVEICNPSVCGTATIGTGLTWSGTQTFTTSLSSGGFFTGTSNGTWTFEFFESYDDSGTDASLTNISIDIQDAISDPDGNYNLGSLPNDDSLVSSSGDLLESGTLDYYTFTIANGVDALGWLNARTSGMDTELGLYDSNGDFVATDDDGNGGYPPGHSMLSFGALDPHTVNPTVPGEDGLILAAGTYTLVVGGYNTAFGLTINDIVGGSTIGDYTLDLNYAPEPATLVLLGLGALGLLRRRR